jgi:hypothetical protein
VDENRTVLGRNAETAGWLTDFDKGRGSTDEVEHNRRLAAVLGPALGFKNEGPAFAPGATREVMESKLKEIDTKARGMVLDKPLSEMDTTELTNEVNNVALLRTAKRTAGEGADMKHVVASLAGNFANPNSGFIATQTKDDAALDEFLKHVQMTHTLKTRMAAAPGSTSEEADPRGEAILNSILGGKLKPVATPEPVSVQTPPDKEAEEQTNTHAYTLSVVHSATAAARTLATRLRLQKTPENELENERRARHLEAWAADLKRSATTGMLDPGIWHAAIDTLQEEDPQSHRQLLNVISSS